MNTHNFILLDKKLKDLADERRWKEYNSWCYILSIKGKEKIPKVDKKMLVCLSSINTEIEKYNICAICIKRHKGF